MRNLSVRGLLVTLSPPVVLLALVAAASLHSGLTVDHMTKDPAAIADMNPLYGVVSNVGALLWCATMSICVFVAMSARKHIPRRDVWFLGASALLTGWLLFDDMFMFHDYLAPRYLESDETLGVLVLLVAIAVYFAAFGRAILKTRYASLALALIFLASSLAADEVFYEPLVAFVGHWQYLVEDGLKLMGIACWCSYYANVAHQLLADSRGRMVERPRESVTSAETRWQSS